VSSLQIKVDQNGFHLLQDLSPQQKEGLASGSALPEGEGAQRFRVSAMQSYTMIISTF
jgi:hypothetical protein